MTEPGGPRLLLIRHAQTPSNVLGALDTGVPGPPLTDLGQEQARVVAAELRAELDAHPPARIHVSSMQRTRLTADPMRLALGAEVEVRDGLREISAGVWEMQSDPESIEQYHAFLAACAGGRDAQLEGGERSSDVIDRFDGEVAEMMSGGDRLVVAFSHGAIIRAWCGRRADNLDEAYVLDHPLRNTGSVLLEKTEGGWTALTWDQTPLDQTVVPTGPPGPTGEPTD